MHVDEFLGFYFPTVNPRSATEAVAIGGDRNNNTSWAARRWVPGRETSPIGRLYACISTVKVDHPRQMYLTKGEADLVRTWFIGLDDIGTKFGAPALGPTTILETSPGNYQYFYRLRYPADPAKAAALIRGLGIAKMTDAGAGRADRYLRVPGSLNTKHTPAFVCRVVEHHPDRAWSLAELEVALGVPAEAPRARRAPSELAPGQIDPLLEWLIAHGWAAAEPDARGWHRMTCPWEDAHTAGPEATKGTDYKPPGGFACLHEHCVDKRTKQLRAWVLEQDPDARLGPEASVDTQAVGKVIAEALQGRNGGRGKKPTSVRDKGRAEDAEDGAESAVDDEVVFKDDDAAVRVEMIDGYIQVEVQDRYWSMASSGLVVRAAIDDRMTARMKQTSLLHVISPSSGNRLKDMSVSAWLRAQPDLQRVANLTHRLGQPLIVDNMLNIAPPIPPRSLAEGDAEPWLDLVDFICGTDSVADLVLDWMALVVTGWGEKPGWHILVKGRPGVGKDLMLQPLVHYLAPKHWYGLTVKDLNKEFTPFLSRRLIMVDELKMTGKNEMTPQSIYNTIKAWTARGTKWVMINEKGDKPYEALDLTCWAPTSNAEVPLPLEDGDRRWNVIETPRAPRGAGYYPALVRWLETEAGHARVIRFLQERWDAMSEERRDVLRGTAPMSAVKQELIDNSAEGIDGAVKLAIGGSYGDRWPDLMRLDDVVSKLRMSDLLSDLAKRSLNAKRVAIALKIAGAARLFEGHPVEDSASRRTMRLWCLRPSLAQSYEAMGTGKAVIDEYDRQRGAGVAVHNILPFKAI